jgi:signal transduction histidine kinase
VVAEAVGQILVVDDNRLNRLTLSHSLEQQGHKVMVAEDGRQALEILSERIFDLVLLDIIMPGMDGYEVLEKMKGEPELHNIPVIVISALEELDSAVRCIEMGAEDYLTKPFNSVFLKARLDACLKRKRLRDLEQAYLQQEVMLRQSEKLATLGRLSAGLAHELNNPAAAIQRGAKQMQLSFEQHLDTELALDILSSDLPVLQNLLETVRMCQANKIELNPLNRSDREYELANWLEDLRIDSAWEFAPDLVEMGFTINDLEQLAATYDQQEFPILVRWMVTSTTILNVVDAVNEAARRISDMVKSLKTYTYLDRAPVQNVDIHEGLENTLIMLRSRLGRGVTVHRHFSENLPLIEAYSSELNQVWTNLIDNAISAMNGHGELTIHTQQEGDWIIVEIADTGSGIPEEIQSKIFDPFFTTKPPGEGTGLGLNISHNIIVQKHKGEIIVTSQPGTTCFQVKLPLSLDHF